MNDARERLRQAGELIPAPAEPFERLLRRRDRRRRRERVMAGALSLALVAGVLGGTIAVLSRTGARGHVTPGSGGSHAGQGRGGAVAPAGSHPLGDGQYFYLKATIVAADGNIVTETWWKSDGSGRAAFDCTIPNCDKVWGSGPTGTFGPGEFPTDSDVTELSTDPAVLANQLLDRTGPNGKSPEPDQISPGPEVGSGVSAGSLWRAITELLRDPNTEPDLRAAIYQVAKTVPGVQVVATATDPAGRPATALEFPYDGGPVVRYDFDPNTLQLLAIEGSGPAGTGTYSVYELGITDSTDQPPSGDGWLTPPITEPLPSSKPTG